MDGRKSVRIDNLSKLTKIDELREQLVEEFDAEPSRQRLFYRGKQVGNGRERPTIPHQLTRAGWEIPLRGIRDGIDWIAYVLEMK